MKYLIKIKLKLKTPSSKITFPGLIYTQLLIFIAGQFPINSCTIKVILTLFYYDKKILKIYTKYSICKKINLFVKDMK